MEEIEPNMRQFPTSLDYRTHSCMPAIKDQEYCGSCWAFASMTPLEFATCNKTTAKQVVLLSEQQLVDCVPYGCDGGWYDTVWKYLNTYGTLSSSAYTYKGYEVGKCPAVAKSVTKPLTWSSASGSGVPGIVSALNKYGPLAAALDAQGDFYNYESGVYANTLCTQTSINHAVMIVGYGSANGIDYWIVRNSWSSWWGDNGYINIKKGVNMCNIEKYLRYVTV